MPSGGLARLTGRGWKLVDSPDRLSQHFKPAHSIKFCEPLGEHQSEGNSIGSYVAFRRYRIGLRKQFGEGYTYAGCSIHVGTNDKVDVVICAYIGTVPEVRSAQYPRQCAAAVLAAGPNINSRPTIAPPSIEKIERFIILFLLRYVFGSLARPKRQIDLAVQQKITAALVCYGSGY